MSLQKTKLLDKPNIYYNEILSYLIIYTLTVVCSTYARYCCMMYHYKFIIEEDKIGSIFTLKSINLYKYLIHVLIFYLSITNETPQAPLIPR